MRKNQTAIKTPPVKELEKIKPKVTSSKNLGKLSQTRLGNPSSLAKASRNLLKHKNKYVVGAGIALAGGAYLLGKNRVATAKEKEKKAITDFNKKEANKPKEMVDVQLFLNRTGTPPKPSKSKLKKKPYNGKEAQVRKKEYFLNTVVKRAASNETQSIAEINGDTLNVKGNHKRSLDRFFGSKLATSLKESGVKMIDTGDGKKNPDRYHFRISDVRSNVS